MSNEITIPDQGTFIVNHGGRLEELERRVLTLGDDPPDDGGCCTVLCCNDSPHDTLATGEQAAYCTVTLEESPGAAVRLAISGFVVVQALSAGSIVFDVAANVNAQNYLERATWQQTLAINDIVTCPMVNTIDSNSAAPSICFVVRNLGVPSIQVVSVNLQVLVYGVRDGSQACGESAGTG